MGGLCSVSWCSRVLCPALGMRVGTCQADCPLRLTCPGPRSTPCFRMSCPRKDASLTACLGGVVVGRPVTGPPGGAAHVVMGGRDGASAGAGGCGVKGSWRRGSIPWVSQDRRGGPGGPRGWDRLWVPGRAWGQRRPRWRLPHAGVGLCSPRGGRDTGAGGDAGAAQPAAEWPVVLFCFQSPHSAFFRIGQLSSVELDDELLDPVSGILLDQAPSRPAPDSQARSVEQQPGRGRTENAKRKDGRR